MQKTLSLPLLLASLSFSFAAAPYVERPPYQRMLSQADQRKVVILLDRSGKAMEEGRFDDAIDLARLAHRVRLTKQGASHWQTNDTAWEIKLLRQMAALKDLERRRLLNAVRRSGELAGLLRKGEGSEAVRLGGRIVELFGDLLGKDHPWVADASSRLGWVLDELGRPLDAAPHHENALRIRLKQLGTDHVWTASAFLHLARNLDARGEHARAEPLHEKALQGARRLYGPGTEEEAMALNNLGLNLHHQGRHAAAHDHHLRALKVRRDLFGEGHGETAQSYNNLALSYHARGLVAEARPFFERSLAIRREVHGDEHLATARAMGDLALCLNSQGRHADAEELYREELRIRRAVQGEDHPDTALSTNNLAVTLKRLGKKVEAGQLYERALSGWRKRLGDNHPRTALGYNAVAVILSDLGRHTEALPVFHRALASRRRALGDTHPDTLLSFENLALSLAHAGEHRRCALLLEHVAAKRRAILGDGHPDTGTALYHLALCQSRLGEFRRAERTADEAARCLDLARVRTSTSGLERAGKGDSYLNLALLAALRVRLEKPTDAWEALERSLARGLLDDLTAAGRLLSPAEKSKRLELQGRVALLERQADALAAARGEDRTKAGKLHRERDRARADLAEFDATLARKYGAAAGQVFSLRAIQKQVPADTAVVGWVDRPLQPAGSAMPGGAWACVLRDRGDPVWVRLPGSGKGGEWTDEDDALVTSLRKSITTPGKDWRLAAALVYGMRLAPLAKHLTGVRHLVVLPSLRLKAVPIEALQAARPKEAPAYSITYAPSATVYAQLRQRERPAGESARLLALGDPTFATVKDEEDEEERTRSGLKPLPGTRREVEAIAKLFPAHDVLLGDEATEAKLEGYARDDQLKAYRYLHLATHGFADPDRPMQSSLALSDRGLPDPVREALRGRPIRTGRLTAGRILGEWKLDAELVTLSACQTGLGQSQAGEGYVGFAQALFVAGARSLLLSQWSVDDEATALLMVRFYENLLGKRKELKKPLRKGEALLEAKEWLRNLTAKQVKAQVESLPRGKLVPKPKERKEAKPFEHPYYWAGFVLVGDPG